MADYAPPSGPPPPRVPEGWKAQWNEQYKEWFYVNLYTKQSQWEKPTEPVYPGGSDGAPAGPPPGYDHNRTQHTGPEKSHGFGTNNPYGGSGASSVNDDEAYARKLQAEEDARVQANRGASDSYYQSSSTPQYGAGASSTPQYGAGASSTPQYSNELPPRDQDRGKSKGGFLGKLLGKTGGSSRPPQQYYGQQQGYGGHGPQYGYAPQQGYYPQQGYPPQQYYGQQPVRKSGGLGAGGGAALGLGAGVLGGALMMDAIDDNQQEAYQEGYDDGGGGDMGGDDMGGDF